MSEIEKRSATWLAVEAWVKEKQAEYERILRTRNLSVGDTEAAREALVVLNDLRNLPNGRRMAPMAPHEEP